MKHELEIMPYRCLKDLSLYPGYSIHYIFIKKCVVIIQNKRNLKRFFNLFLRFRIAHWKFYCTWHFTFTIVSNVFIGYSIYDVRFHWLTITKLSSYDFLPFSSLKCDFNWSFIIERGSHDIPASYEWDNRCSLCLLTTKFWMRNVLPRVRNSAIKKSDRCFQSCQLVRRMVTKFKIFGGILWFLIMLKLLEIFYIVFLPRFG